MSKQSTSRKTTIVRQLLSQLAMAVVVLVMGACGFQHSGPDETGSRSDKWIEGQDCPADDPAVYGFPAARAPLTPQSLEPMPGEFAVTSSGDATYTLPIWVPPGRQGMQPKLAVAYNSSVVEGELGARFTLQGLSEITRCGQTPARDGQLREVRYDAGDRFCLDGAPLVVVNDRAYGADGAEYRTMPDSFVKVISTTPNASDGPISFKVWSRDGRVSEYGGTKDSQINATGYNEVSQPGLAKYRAWAISRVADLSGNYMTYAYTNIRATDDYGHQYVSSHRIRNIEYAGHNSGLSPTRTIEFKYNESQSHECVKYTGGMMVAIDRQLLGINETVDGSIVRMYEFVYENTSPSGRPHLTMVQECPTTKVDPSCRSTTFSWRDFREPDERSPTVQKSIGFDQHDTAIYQKAGSPFPAAPDEGSEWVVDLGDPAKVLDVNGDGRSDLVVPHDYTFERSDWGYRRFYKWTSYLTDRRLAFIPQGPSVQVEGFPFSQFNSVPIDYNWDGHQDLLIYGGWKIPAPCRRLDGYFLCLPGTVMSSTGSSLAAPTRLDYGAFIPVDFNGDGMLDALNCENNSWRVNWYDTKAKFYGQDQPLPKAVSDVTPCSVESIIMDVNGDGAQDMLFVDPATPGMPLEFLSYSDGGWIHPMLSAPPGAPLRVPRPLSGRPIDVNGDGLDDLLLRKADDTLVVYINMGGRIFSRERETSIKISKEDLESAPMLDLNGDGFMDLVVRTTKSPATTDYWKLLPSNGNEFSVSDSEIRRADFERLQRFSYDGNPNSALIGWKKTDAQPKYYVLRNRIVRPDMVVAIDKDPEAAGATGHVPSVEIAYGQMVGTSTLGGDRWDNSQHPFYDPQRYSGCSEHARCAVGGKLLVKSYSVNTAGYYQNDGTPPVQGNGPRKHHMYYRDGRYDPLWGWLGFRVVVDVSQSYPPGSDRGVDPVIRGQEFDNSAYGENTKHHWTAGRIAREWTAVPMPGQVTASRDYFDNESASCDVRAESYEYEERAEFGGKTYFVFPYLKRSTTRTNASCRSYHVDDRSTQFETSTTTDYWPDDYGNVAHSGMLSGGVRSLDIYTTYLNVTTGGFWVIGLPQDTTITSAEGPEIRTRREVRTYDALNRLDSITTDPELPTELVQKFGHDVYGNVTSVVEKETSTGETRGSCVRYDADVQMFPRVTSNYAGLTSYSKYDTALGVITHSVDPNRLVTRRKYDMFGRLLLESVPQGPITTISRTRVIVDGGTRIQTKTAGNDGTEVTVEHDQLGRERRKWTWAIGHAERALEEFWYDARFNSVTRHRVPTFEDGSSSVPIETTRYDGFGRVVDRWAPDGANTHYDRTGFLSTTAQDPKQHKTVVRRDQALRVISVEDAKGKTTTYEYQPFDQLWRITDPGNHVTVRVTDVHGHVTSTSDPDRGPRSYVYNAFGQVRQSTDAANQVAGYVYDALGRQTDTTCGEYKSGCVYTHTIWDTAPNGKGKIARRDIDGANTWEEYAYDTNGRVQQTSLGNRLYTGASFVTGRSYWPSGQLKTLTYPGDQETRFAIEYHYERGQVDKVSDANNPNFVFWKRTESDAGGRGTIEEMANGALRTEREYDDWRDGVLLGVGTTRVPASGDPSFLQADAYSYDETRNLESKWDEITEQFETYCYDELNRLTDGAVRAQVVCGSGQTYHYAYSDDGNISSSNGLGAYQYDPARPHQVVAVGNSTFGYDANGNRNREPDALTRYMTNQLPRWRLQGNVSVTDIQPPCVQAGTCRCDSEKVNGSKVYYCGTSYTSFMYDGDGNRVLKSGPSSRTLYVGDVYQKVSTAVGATSLEVEKYFIKAGGRTVAVVQRKYQAESPAQYSTSYQYLHTDNLGSVVLITDENGSVLERRTYEPFGKRIATGGGTTSSLIEKTSYTGHEEDDEFGLINMKGRLYDPTIGRFLSPDPVVSNVLIGQAWNPYGYVLNNPLRYTDPTGYEPFPLDFGFGGAGGYYSYGGAGGGTGWGGPSVIVTLPDFSVTVGQSGLASASFDPQGGGLMSGAGSPWDSGAGGFSSSAGSVPYSQTGQLGIELGGGWSPEMTSIAVTGAMIGGTIAMAAGVCGVGAIETAVTSAQAWTYSNAVALSRMSIGLAESTVEMTPGTLEVVGAVGLVAKTVTSEVAGPAIRVTEAGLARVEAHLARLGALVEPANAAMLDRLSAGKIATQEVNFYMHELKESAVISRMGGYGSYDIARAAHLETLQWQGILYAPGYESQLYHPDVIRSFSEMFNPAAWPK